MGKHLTELSAQELNSFLVEKYSFGLYPFALILEWINRIGDWSSWQHLPNRQQIIHLINKTKNFKEKIIETMADIESYHFQTHIKDLYEKSKDEFLNRMNDRWIKHGFDLIKFIDYLDGKKCFFEHMINKKRRGPPIKKQNLITSLWAHLIRETKNLIKWEDWEIIASIFSWFSSLLHPYKIYEDCILKIENEEKEEEIELKIDCQYLKNEFYRNKKRSYEVFKFIKDQFFNNNLFNCKSIVIFSNEYSTIIEYKRLDRFYKDTINDKKRMELFNEILFKKIILQHSYSLILSKAYWFYAAKLYINNSKNPPQILFPDLSFI